MQLGCSEILSATSETLQSCLPLSCCIYTLHLEPKQPVPETHSWLLTHLSSVFPSDQQHLENVFQPNQIKLGDKLWLLTYSFSVDYGVQPCSPLCTALGM